MIFGAVVGRTPRAPCAASAADTTCVLPARTGGTYFGAPSSSDIAVYVSCQASEEQSRHSVCAIVSDSRAEAVAKVLVKARNTYIVRG
jgi:hypothetical protein